MSGATHLGVRVDERAAAPLLTQPCGERVEHAEDAGRAGRPQVREQEGLPAPRPATQVERDQLVLRAEPVVQRLLRGACGLGNEVDADGTDAPPVEQLGRRVEKSLASGRQSRVVERGLGQGHVEQGHVGQSHRHLLMHCEYTDRYGYLPSMDRRHVDAALAVALVVLWSSGFVGARLGTDAATATTLLVWRLLCAAAVLGLIAAVRRPRLPRGAVWRQAVLGLLVQLAYLEGVVTGIGMGVPAGTAALIAATQPLLIAAAGSERTSGRQRWGLAVGLSGVGLVVAGDLG